MTRTLEDVLRDVEASGVLPDFDGHAWLSSLPDESRPTDGEQFAKELVRRKVLTKYQAEQIYSGRGKALALGNYVVLDKLGQGGMGMVLKAQHRRMGRVVAIKVMSPAGMKSPDAVKRFQREVQAAAKLEHPNIVTAYDADESGGMHFLVMQYVDGTDLQVHVKRHGPLPVERAVHCIVQAARGLAFAHEQGVIHRDIKPANLLLDSKGTVRILDMGLARIEGAVGGGVENAGLTSSGMIMGTVDFMSPEQAIDTKRADARSDIYSLGCTLYYLLTGRTVYDDDTVMKRLMAHQQKAIPSLVESISPSGSQQKSGSSQSADSAVASAEAPISLAAELTALDAVFRRLVAKKPEDRPQTMTEVIAELEGCLTGSSSSLTLAGSGGLSGSSGLSSVSRSQLSGSVTGAISDSKVAIAEDSAFSETMISSAGEAATDPQILVTGGSLDRWKKRHSSSSGTSSAWWRHRRVQIGGGLAAILLLTAIVFAVTRNGAEQTGVVFPDARQSAKNSPKGDSSTNTGNAGQAGQQDLSSEARPPDVPAPAVTVPSNAESGASDSALQFVGTGRVEIPSLTFDLKAPFTWECFVTAPQLLDATAPRGAVLLGVDRHPDTPHNLSLTRYSFWRWKHSAGLDGSNTAFVKIPSRPQRTHMACVRNGVTHRLFVDGRLAQSMDSSSAAPFEGPFIIGSRFVGIIDEVRISKSPRYTAGFMPADRHSPDPDTLALYHCDEGTGDVLVDSSGNNHHGRISGVKWLKGASLVADAGPPVAKFPFDAKQASAHQQAWANHLRVPVEFTNGLGMRFRLIPPGEFQMGLGPEFTDDELKRLTGLTREMDLNRSRASRPAHPVRITRPFYMQVDEVTSGHYQNIMGQLRPEMEQDPNDVLTKWVVWPDAISFCNRLSEREGRQPAYRIDGTQITVIDDANGYRLPTEAQWEYACRAGTNTLWYFGAEASADIRTFRNQASAPNPFGLTALYGGANEWCWDATDLNPYSVVTPGPHIDPRIDAGSMRIKRGGGNQDGSGANRFLVNSYARGKTFGGPYGSHPMHHSGFGRVVLPLSEPAKLPAPSDSAVIPLQTTKPVDLLALVDPGLDVVSGEWKRDGAGFISDLLSTNSYLRLPVEPGEAFSLRVAFSTNRGNFSVVLPLESKGLELFVSVGKIELCLKPPKTLTNSVFALSKPVNDDQRHELVIEVTRPAADEVRLQVQVDGQTAVDWRGTRGQLADISGRYAAETSLGISTFLPVLAPTRLLSAELTTTRGSARFLRPSPVASQPPLAKAPFDAGQARAHQEAWARHLGTQVETTNSVGQKMILIPPGEFLMGSTDAQVEAALKVIDDEGANQAARDRIQKAERPQHKVVISRPYLMSSTEVTIGQFKKFSATGYVTEAEKASKLDPGYRTYLSDGADDLPAAFLSWTDVVAYCQWLSTQEAKTYRLPTEAEWEYACRAGTTTQYSFGDDDRELPRYGWYDKNSGGRSHPVGTLLANNFGLFDMHGSVSEWCSDRFDENWYAASPQNDPFLSSGGSGFAVRGGYWSNPHWFCRSANRNSVAGVYRLSNYGFRVVAEIDAVQTRGSVSPPVPPAGVTPSPTPVPAGLRP